LHVYRNGIVYPYSTPKESYTGVQFDIGYKHATPLESYSIPKGLHVYRNGIVHPYSTPKESYTGVQFDIGYKHATPSESSFQPIYGFYVSCPNRFGLKYLLISGVNAFMVRMANEMPSGYDPKTRMTMVRMPMPMPYTIMPGGVMGEVT